MSDHFGKRKRCGTNVQDEERKSETNVQDEEREQLVQTKRDHIDNLKQECGSKRPLNVCVIGTYGAGKSSFINTVAAALNWTRWREYAAVGDFGGTRGVTTYVQRFPKCCHEEGDRYKDVSLPTLIDMAGWKEDEDLDTEEVLRIFFFGQLGHGDALQEAREHYVKHGVNGLKEKYSQNMNDNEVYKIDRIIFVASARQNLPRTLIENVVNAAQPSGSIRDRYKRSIPIFGVLTHAGPMELEKDVNLEKMEKHFLQSLGISRNRLLLCSNYCDDIDGGSRTESTIPELDIPVLKFMIQVCDRSLAVLHDDEMYQGESRRPPSLLQTMMTKIRSNPYLVIFGCFIIVLVFWLLHR